MCSVCWHDPCHPRCPNAPEPDPVAICEYCDEGICEGEKMAKIDDKYYHLDCLNDMGTSNLLELLGVDLDGLGAEAILALFNVEVEEASGGCDD